MGNIRQTSNSADCISFVIVVVVIGGNDDDDVNKIYTEIQKCIIEHVLPDRQSNVYKMVLAL